MMYAPQVARRADASGLFAEEAIIRPFNGSTVFEVTYLPAAETRIGAVICGPVLVEQLTNYRYEVLLARSLASQGISVQRFHYRGTGHSGGEDAELSLESMVEDALGAAERLQARTPIERLVFQGTRLGALVAAMAARAHAASPLVFWEPVVDGGRYLRELIRARLVRELKDARYAESGTSAWKDELDSRGWIDILGYALHLPLHTSVQSARLDVLLQGRATQVLLVQLGRQGDLRPDLSRLREVLIKGGSRVDVRYIQEEPAWFFPGAPMKSADRLISVTTDWVSSLSR